jgi:Na+-translocating ferredoxin:NAD+ oxidoreductase RnfC subunit
MDAFHLVDHRKLQVFECCQKQQLSLICTSYIPLQEQQKRGSSTIWKICTHTQQPNSHTQQVTTPKNQKGKTKKLQQTLQTAVFDNNGDLGVKSLQTLFM